MPYLSWWVVDLLRSPSYSSIHFENAELHANDTIPFFYNSFVAGESVYLRIYLADQFNNYCMLEDSF